LYTNLVGIGLPRFAYTPLTPALIAAYWFSPSATVNLGAANLAAVSAAPCLRSVAHLLSRAVRRQEVLGHLAWIADDYSLDLFRVDVIVAAMSAL
jgi:hypothetical protein